MFAIVSSAHKPAAKAIVGPGSRARIAPQTQLLEHSSHIHCIQALKEFKPGHPTSNVW